MKWNEAQLSAINTRNSNILVSAAAGSGKTAVLTERIKSLIVSQDAGIDEMLIVTFTNAAAGEMRERIFKGISEAMEEEGADVSYLQDQLDRIGSANISTFHAFCLEVIREYFYLTELAPDFKICDDAQNETFSQEAMDIMLNEMFEKEEKSDFLTFASKYSKANNEKDIGNMVNMVYKFIKSLPDPFGWLNKRIEDLKNSDDEVERNTYRDACVLRDMILRYDRLLIDKKYSSNQLSFNDVEHLALEILAHPEPSHEYRERFKYIFIDEYQDTNEVQEELINRIKRSDNLFMVGDVKQSIYQFRLADPQIFIEKYKRFKTGDKKDGIKIDLNRNFRSKPEVLSCTNRVMERIMTEETSGISYDADAKLYPGFDYGELLKNEPSAEPVIMDLIVEKDIKDAFSFSMQDADPVKGTELEALFVCRRIKEVLGREYFDVKSGKVKKVTLDDIVVLLRSYKGSAEVYQDVFQREGIPAYIEGNDGYFETVEISVFANLLRIIVNKRQDIPLLSVMRSAMFRFTADEMSAVRVFRKKGLFAEAFLDYCKEGEDPELKEKCCSMLNRLEEWKDRSQYMSLKDLLWMLLRESGFYDFVRALPMGAQRVKNLKALIEKAEKYQKNTSQNLTGFIKYLELLELNSAPMSSEKPGGDNESYVRMMSIHKSKGLEFPVVIVAGLGKSFNHRKASSEISLDKDLGFGLRFRDDKNRYKLKTQRQLDIDDNVKAKELAEEMRILYVAMTRAREQLILIGTVKKLEDKLPGEDKEPLECTSFLEWLAGPMQDAETLGEAKLNIHREFPWNCEEEEASEELQVQQDGSFSEEDDKAVKDRIFAEYDFEYKFKEASEMPAKFTATELNRIMKNMEDTDIDIPVTRTLSDESRQERKLSAAEKGTLTHNVLQELDLAGTNSVEEIEAQIEDLAAKGRISQEEAGEVRGDWIFRFFESDIGRRMKKAKTVYREKPFLLWRPCDEECGSIVQGIIDCFFEEDNEYVLIDYKTDHIPAEGREAALALKADSYLTQMNIYKEAIESSSGKKVKESYLYFLSAGQEVRI
ncbi:MAG: UvrD-helicase domain-containing protein [Firmicutes bacterium]|nr:UvrD-helicase domain-containing protein [Bacillota bacterium]